MNNKGQETGRQAAMLLPGPTPFPTSLWAVGGGHEQKQLTN